MDLAGLPVLLVRELSRVDGGDQAHHGCEDGLDTAVSALVMVALVDRRQDVHRWRPPGRDGPLVVGYRRDAGVGHPRVVVDQRAHDVEECVRVDMPGGVLRPTRVWKVKRYNWQGGGPALGAPYGAVKVPSGAGGARAHRMPQHRRAATWQPNARTGRDHGAGPRPPPPLRVHGTYRRA